MLIPFPITLLTLPVVTDLAFVLSEDAFWARVSLWSVAAGTAAAIVAAVAGTIDFAADARVRSHRVAWLHMIGNTVIIVLGAVSAGLRIGDASGAVLPIGIALSVVIAAALGLTGWAGAELSYRHNVGVTSDDPYRTA